MSEPKQKDILDALKKAALTQRQLDELKRLRRKNKQQEKEIERFKEDIREARKNKDEDDAVLYRARKILGAFKVISEEVSEMTKEDNDFDDSFGW